MVEIWQIWITFSVAFIIAEIFTAGFFMLWLGVGAAIAALLAYFGFSSSWQWGVFAIISLALFALSRKFAEKITKEQPPGVGANRLIGKKGAVLEGIDNKKNTGRVRIDKDEWRADGETKEILAVGERVEVTSVEGTHLIVKKLEEEE